MFYALDLSFRLIRAIWGDIDRAKARQNKKLTRNKSSKYQAIWFLFSKQDNLSIVIVVFTLVVSLLTLHNDFIWWNVGDLMGKPLEICNHAVDRVLVCWCVISIKNLEYLTWLLVGLEEVGHDFCWRCYLPRAFTQLILYNTINKCISPFFSLLDRYLNYSSIYVLLCSQAFRQTVKW